MKQILSLITAVILITLSVCGGQTQNPAANGKVTSDLSIFPDLPSRVEITFEILP